MFAKRALLLGCAVAVAGAFAASACNQNRSPVSPSAAAGGSAEAKPGGISAVQLNLSHIECVEGQVEIHFVLLHVPEGITPGSLEWSLNGAAQAPVSPGDNTGNVWHYTVYVAPGNINVTSASVAVGGTTINLHNPGEYAGEYLCTGDLSCVVNVPTGWTEGEVTCLGSPLGNPGAECAVFGLVPSGSEGGSGSSHTASQSAAIAIVKDGVGPCSPGQNAYTFYSGVTAGQSLAWPFSGSISHVTYCECPPQ